MKAFTNSSAYCKQTSAGFTLIELMITIAIIAIIITISAPSMATQLANQRVKSTTATLVNALKEAKAESIIRRQAVTLSYQNTTPKAVVATGLNATKIASFSYNTKSTITSTAATTIFQPSKHVDAAITYTICDSNASAKARQVIVTKVATITSQTGGRCK